MEMILITFVYCSAVDIGSFVVRASLTPRTSHFQKIAGDVLE